MNILLKLISVVLVVVIPCTGAASILGPIIAAEQAGRADEMRSARPGPAYDPAVRLVRVVHTNKYVPVVSCIVVGQPLVHGMAPLCALAPGHEVLPSLPILLRHRADRAPPGC